MRGLGISNNRFPIKRNFKRRKQFGSHLEKGREPTVLQVEYSDSYGTNNLAFRSILSTANIIYLATYTKASKGDKHLPNAA